MTLGRTSSGAIKIKTDEAGGGLRAVNCVCCGGSGTCGGLVIPTQFSEIVENAQLSIPGYYPTIDGASSVPFSNFVQDKGDGWIANEVFFIDTPDQETQNVLLVTALYTPSLRILNIGIYFYTSYFFGYLTDSDKGIDCCPGENLGPCSLVALNYNIGGNLLQYDGIIFAYYDGPTISSFDIVFS